MLSGTANVDILAARAPVMRTLSAAPVVFAPADVLQVLYEIDSAQRQTLLPPGLHPTDPALVNWLVYKCAASPWGPFAMAQTRIECRSGLRLRVFLVAAVVDNEAAAEGLQRDWGFTTRVGQVSLQRFYDAVHLRVALDGETVLALTVADPEPLAAGDIQYVPNMNLAHTPKGVRLVQVEPRYHIARAERGRPDLQRFNAEPWGAANLHPVYPVSASLAAAEITVPAIRFLCRSDVWAFEGTETVESGS